MWTYEEWLDKVDFWLTDRSMMTHDCIDTYDFESAYNDKKSPLRAAIESLFDIDLDYNY